MEEKANAKEVKQEEVKEEKKDNQELEKINQE